MTKHWEKRMYRTTLRVLSKPPAQRLEHETNTIEPFFRRKSKLLDELSQESILDLIKHCQFVTRNVNDVIIHQGEKGHKFYIILRGSVSILHKDSLEDVDLGEEQDQRVVDRSTLGTRLTTKEEGGTFGEIALINPDCIRTASVVADEETDLIVVDRELYNKNLSKVIAREYAAKMAFIDSVPLFDDWSMKWKKHLATSFKKETLSFDVPLFKQGEPATDMFFIVSGEVKLQVEPEAHHQQFERYLAKSGPLLGPSAPSPDANYFPVKLIPQIEKFSRVSRANARSRGQPGDEEPATPTNWSPSSIRKMNQQRKVAFNICLLGDRQHVGDIEFVLGLDVYHATAVCSQETVVYCLQRPHFDRLFKRRNPRSVKSLASMLELQLSVRLLKPNMLESTPLLQVFLANLQQMNNPLPTLGNRNGDQTPRLVAHIRTKSAKLPPPTR